MQRRAMLLRNLPPGPLDLCIVPRVLLGADYQSCQMIVLPAPSMFGPESKRCHNLPNGVSDIAALQFDHHIERISL